MKVALLDVNVLVALFDPAHPDHEEAHAWFGRHSRRGWATCPVTVNGCVRVLSSPAYRSVEATAAEVVAHLRVLCSQRGHHFWSEGVSLLDETLFRPELIAGHQQVTDLYLLGLAVRQHGRLATFDRSIPVKAVIGAGADHLAFLGAPAT